MNDIPERNVQDNISRYYLFHIAWMFWLPYAIDIVFYRANGISISQITVIDVIWAVAAFIMEVPSGLLSDRWRRKYMLVGSGLSASAGFLIFSLTGSFFPFVIATIFMAARLSLQSGTANALVYDSLKQINREEDFEKVLGRSRLLGLISISTAGVIGAFLAQSDIRIPYWLSIISSGAAALIAATFVEPEIHTPAEATTLVAHIRQAGRLVLTHPFLRFVFLYLILMDIAISYLDEYDQIYLTAIDFPLALFGVWIALRRLLGGLGGFLAERFKRRPSAHLKTFAILVMILGICAIVFGNKYVGLAAFLVIFPIWGVNEVLIYGEIHSQVESHQRATIESLMIFFGVLLDIPARLGFGFISEAWGIRVGYLFVMAILVLYLPYFLIGKPSLDAKNQAGP